jgi:hypothetical protein
MLRPTSQRRTERDLPLGLTRTGDGTTWTDTSERTWRHVRRNELSALTDEQWQRARLVLRRPAKGWLPCSYEATTVQDLLISLGMTTGAEVLLLAVAPLTDDPRGFVLRAVRHRHSHLVLLLRTDGGR